MCAAKQHRRYWTREEKIFFVKLLQVPLKNGHPKSVNDVSKEFGISRKVLYEWQEIYSKQGEAGFEPRPRKEYQGKFRRGDLNEKICSLSLLHPDWGAQKLIDHLKREGSIITSLSIPTVLKILHQHQLGNIGQRYAATERSYVQGKVRLPQATIDMLVQHNPYLRLFKLNQQIKGVIFFLKAMPLAPYFGKGSGSVLLAVESHSLLTFGRHWDGKSKRDLETFVLDVEALGKGKYKANNYFLAENKSAFSKLKRRPSYSPVRWLDSRETTGTDEDYFDAIKGIFNFFRKSFLRKHEFSDMQQLASDLNTFLTKLMISPGPEGYPCFDESPNIAHKNHLENLFLLLSNTSK